MKKTNHIKTATTFTGTDLDRVGRGEHLAPQVSPVEALRRNLLYRMFGAVAGDDMGEVIANLVARAKHDNQAAKILIGMTLAGPAVPPVVVVTPPADQADGHHLNGKRRNRTA
jgi:hypothetical protein